MGKRCYECCQATNTSHVKINANVDDQGKRIFLNEGWGDDKTQNEFEENDDWQNAKDDEDEGNDLRNNWLLMIDFEESTMY